jgi:hypothetical protein
MNRSIFGRAAAALFLLLISQSSSAVSPDELNLITFKNNTGQDITYIFLSPGDSEHWGTDILGSTRVLGDDDELGFYIHYPERCNEFDIYAVGANEDSFLVYGFEICDGTEAEVELTRRNLDAAAPNFEYTTVTIANDTDYRIDFLFFSPDDSEMWGVDQLDKDTTMSPGDEVSVLLPVGDTVVRYDVQAVDEDEDTYTFVVEINPKLDEHRYSIVNSDLD